MGRALFALLATFTLAGARADDPPAGRGPLADLPSKPGPHLAKVAALGDGEWRNLGAPAADPKWGKARGSSWGAKAFAAAPDRRGAFLFGEGVHGFVKPDGHAMDDLWFYDLNAHRWLCLHPGTDTAGFTRRVKAGDLRVGDDGLLRDRSDKPVPVHTLIHAWGNLAYDPDRRKFAFLGGDGLSEYYLGGVNAMREGLDLLKAQRVARKRAAFSPWFYDAATGRFERAVAAGSPGAATGAFPQLHYLPSEKRFALVGTDSVAFYDPAANRWDEARPKGAVPTGYDRAGCYDSKRHRVYQIGGDGGLLAYDLKAGVWSDLGPAGTAPASAGTNGAFYEYVPQLDRVIAIDFKGTTPGVFAYDPVANAWEAPRRLPAGGPKFRHAANTFYDRESNAFYCHVAGDSADDGVIWAYRHKRLD